jgi:hypothetical protein
MKKYFVDAKIELGRAYIIRANSVKEAEDIVRENIEDYNDQAHFEIEMDTMEMKE